MLVGLRITYLFHEAVKIHGEFYSFLRIMEVAEII